MKLTDNEKALLSAILNSEYHDSSTKSGALEPVWISCIWGFEGKAKFGGTMASLSKKGLAETDGTETCWLTEKGYDAAMALNLKK